MRVSLILVTLLAPPGPARAQTPDAQRQQAVEALRGVAAAVDNEVTGLDGIVTADIVLAGDGRLTALLRQGDRLIKSLESMLGHAKRLAAQPKGDPAPFESVCKDLTGAGCSGGAGEGFLTVLKAEDSRLREALKRMKAERKGKSRAVSDACQAAQDAESSTRLAARASTRLALTASALNTALAPGGSLAAALDKAADQASGKDKRSKEVRTLLRATKAQSIARHRAFMKALAGKEKATKGDLKALKEARDRSAQSTAVFAGIAQGMKRYQGESAGGLSLEVSLESDDTRQLTADIDAMLAAKKTFLVAGPADPQSKGSAGVFPALRSAETAVQRACGIRAGVAKALADLSQAP